MGAAARAVSVAGVSVAVGRLRHRSRGQLVASRGFGPARFSPVQPGSVRPGPARVRFGPVRFGPVRPGVSRVPPGFRGFLVRWPPGPPPGLNLWSRFRHPSRRSPNIDRIRANSSVSTHQLGTEFADSPGPLTSNRAGCTVHATSTDRCRIQPGRADDQPAAPISSGDRRQHRCTLIPPVSRGYSSAG